MERAGILAARGIEELWPLPGAHILHIYTSEMERRHGLMDFISDGLARGERICCVHDRPIDDCLAEPSIQQALASPGRSGTPALGALPILTEPSRGFYLPGGVFDHGQVYGRWRDFCIGARRLGFPGARLLGEVLPELGCLAEGQAIIFYEMNLNQVIQRLRPTCVVCQYDARAFRGDVLAGILKAHPLVLACREVWANPFFEPPEAAFSH